MMFWNNLYKIRSKKYSIRKRTRVRIGIVFKYKRVSSKKIIKKTKTSTLLRTLKINLPFNILTNSPPLGTLLNLIGINTQKFCEELNKDLNALFFNNVLIILKIFIYKNLSYDYLIDLNYNFLLRNLSHLQNIKLFCNPCATANFITLNNEKNAKIFSSMDEIFLKRIFFNFDIFFISMFLWLFQFFIIKFNFFNNNFFYFFNIYLQILTFESLNRTLYSTLKSFNLKLFKIKKKLLLKKN